MDQQDIDIIEAFQRLGHALRRTGTVIIALGLTAGIGTVFDFPGDEAVANTAIALILVNGIAMFMQASSILKLVDSTVLKLLGATVRGRR